VTESGFLDIGRLLNPNGVIPAPHFLVSVLSAVFVLAIPALRKRASLLFVCAVATAAIYRRALFGYLLTNAIVFLFMLVLDRAASYRDQKSRFRWRWTCAAILALIFAFLFGRSWHFNTRGPSVGGIQWVLFSLDMWLVLRLITILWEFGSGRVRRTDILSYSIWIGFPFISFGPIIRYSQFDPQLSSRERVEVIRKTFSTDWLGKFLVAILQIVAGLILTNLHQVIYASGGAGLPVWAKLLDGFGISPWGFLFVWAGYYQAMECLALMWGVRLPPSFNRPFGRENISKFWANWNMTATSVFRDYLFYNRWGGKSINVYLNTLIIFILVGMWHSFNLYWVLWGLMHGIGFCVFIWYSHSRLRQALDCTRLPAWRSRLFGGVVTYLFVCSCWILPSQFLKLVGRV
jgi:D-alanyl-lipoteichoic acid acyltransferase DltB (MBOAT superfamily)